jgi:hypothetical protein
MNRYKRLEEEADMQRICMDEYYGIRNPDGSIP